MSEERRHSERSEEPGRAGGAPSAQPDPSLTLGMTAQIGIIGGSGLYEMEGLRVLEERNVATPFGEPSDPFVIGEIDGVRVAFLSRHGRGHRRLPSELNYRANIHAFKQLGAHTILSASAVGSMKEAYEPTHIVFPHQFIDRTRHRPDTFFGDGVVGHVAFADPICAASSKLMATAARECGAFVHEGGVYICIEGPQFSTRAESSLYRSWGVDVIGMTNLQEAKLAREAEICYVTMALVTDYDCWHESGDVSVEQILAYLRANAAMAQRIIRATIPRVAARQRDCACASALQYAIITDPALIPAEVKRDLAPIIGKYIS
jgi:5'-methylthioadenosine phosphorylase